MKLILIIVLVTLSYGESLKYTSNNIIVRNRINYKNKVLTLNVIDQVQDNAAILLQDNTNAFVDGFERSFSGTMISRLLGGIIGNIVAGLALTAITVALSKTVWNKDNKRNDDNKNTNDIENENKLNTKTIPIEAWGKLLICIAIDFLGDASYVIPGIGELEDVAWAPLSAFLLSKLFNNNVLTTFEFVKEIIPGTDFIPVATISWLLEYVFAGTFISKSLKNTNK